MKNYVIHRANTRGHANHGWLNARHTFSFARYHDPNRVHFGALRVLNDDIIAGGGGFGTHPHDNMEIITIPLHGSLQHKDSMGNGTTIAPNEVQIMSAGTGIQHSEFNASKTDEINLLQIWIFPKVANIQPRYDQRIFEQENRINRLQTIVEPLKKDSVTEGVGINQDAWISRICLEAGHQMSYQTHLPTNGVYVFVIEGEAIINQNALQRRDGAGFWDGNTLSIQATYNTELLFIEVPMQ